MNMATPKQSIVTFKAEQSLTEALRGVPNRSAFIRSAILAALESACPLCGGTGILTREQKKHWDAFAVDHALRECTTCHEYHLVCGKKGGHSAHTPRRSTRTGGRPRS
jgi:hypothetical protein